MKKLVKFVVPAMLIAPLAHSAPGIPPACTKLLGNVLGSVKGAAVGTITGTIFGGISGFVVKKVLDPKTREEIVGGALSLIDARHSLMATRPLVRNRAVILPHQAKDGEIVRNPSDVVKKVYEVNTEKSGLKYDTQAEFGGFLITLTERDHVDTLNTARNAAGLDALPANQTKMGDLISFNSEAHIALGRSAEVPKNYRPTLGNLPLPGQSMFAIFEIKPGTIGIITAARPPKNKADGGLMPPYRLYTFDGNNIKKTAEVSVQGRVEDFGYLSDGRFVVYQSQGK